MHTIKFSIVCLCMVGILYAGWLIEAPFETEYPRVVADFSEKMDLNSDGIVQKNEFIIHQNHFLLCDVYYYV